MSSSSCESDDAPEEFTSQQGLEQQQQINKAQQLSILSARLQLKERRKKRAQRLTPKSKPKPQLDHHDDHDHDMVEDHHQDDDDDDDDDDDNPRPSNQSQINSGMLPDHIVRFLAQRQNQVFLSHPDEDKVHNTPKRKKKTPNISGIETVILKELPPSHCVHNSLEFLKKRKMQVPRSSAVLNNSNQALRLLSSSGLLK